VKYFKFLTVLFLLIVPVFLSACDKIPFLNQGASDQPVELTYWGLWESEPVIQSLIAAYQANNPNVTVSYQRQTPQQYRERLEARIAAGEGPDIFRFHNTWVPMLKEELATLPSSVMDESTFTSTFNTVAVNDLKTENGLVGIPLEYDGLGLYYNEDIFKSAGIVKVPTTWEEVRQTASKITVRDANGAIQTAGVALGSSTNIDHFSDILALMMMQNSVNLSKPTDARVGLTSQLATDALDFYLIFAKDSQTRVWDETLPASTLAFASGKLGMYFAPSWRAFEIKQANPSLKFKIAPVPQLPPNPPLSFASYWVEGVSSQSPDQEEAWKFIAFLSEPDNLRTLYAEASKTRLFGEPYSRRDLSSSVAADQFVGGILSDASNAKSWYLSSNTFDNGINDQMIEVFKTAVTDAAKNNDSKRALSTASSKANEILSKFGSTSR